MTQIILEKLTVFSASQEILSFHGYRRFISVSAKTHYWTLSWVSPQPHKDHSNRSPKCSLLL